MTCLPDADKIAVIGLGFVGLTTAVGLAEKTGLAVVGYDCDAARSAQIRAGQLPFVEPGLDAALVRQLGSGFTVVDSLAAAVADATVVFLCVGTPCGEDSRADLSELSAALAEIRPLAGSGGFKTIVVKSTVPPRSADELLIPLLTADGLELGRDVGYASNPEFLREGHCWPDFIYPDRIVIGCHDEVSRAALTRIYQPFAAPMLFMEPATAEFVKYLSNTLLATMISYANEMDAIAAALGGIDVDAAFAALHLDRRWALPAGGGGDGGGCESLAAASMASYVLPGTGFGGYCLPKDTQALAASARSAGVAPEILEAVLAVNDRARTRRALSIIQRCSSPDSVIGLYGLSFKPGSDDVRDSPAAAIIGCLLEQGYHNIIVFDPLAMDAFRAAYHLPVRYAASVAELLRSCEVVDAIKGDFAGASDDSEAAG
ncbi:MAG: nucleotide sugar dehydrogenase [Coriobacteriales bacterium]|jgi:UDPglucose 6-dehydrogenase|nr:nucleotide sugar dehydrogenase [Coriobacteriales bacterium]